MGIETRIKELRKHLDLTQTEFGDALGVSRDVINSYERGRVVPTSLFLDHLCMKYSVDPIWLETGEGEMFHKPSEAEEMAAFSAKMISDPDPFKRRFFYALSRMDESGWDKVKEFLQFLKEAEQKENDGN